MRKLEYCYMVCKSRFGLATEIGQNLLQNRQQFGDLFQAQNFGHKMALVLNAKYQNAGALYHHILLELFLNLEIREV